MIDPTLRIERLRKEVADPNCGVIIMDVVLGHGADPDPASALAPAIKEATSQRAMPVIIALIGSSGDPQGIEKQAKLLSDAGAYVTVSNATAIRTAISLIKASEAS
jgi:FdrA protein